MNTALRSGGLCIVLPLIAFSLIDCAGNKPGAADVTASLQQSLPGYIVSGLECESFADRSQEGAGRTSCRGSIAPDQDLYSPLSAQEVQSLLSAAGVPQEGVAFFAGRHPQQIFRLSVGRGTTTPLTADCTYLRKVDGWQIGCTHTYNNFMGQSLESWGANAVVQDSTSYRTYIDTVLTDFRQLNTAYRALSSQVERFFSPGRTIYLLNHYAGTNPVMTIRLGAPISWAGPRGFLGYQAQARIEPHFQASEDRTLCGYGRGVPNNVVRLDVTIDPSSPRDIEQGAGPFTAHVGIFEPTALFNNGFSGCGNSLGWNGTSWGGAGPMALELRAQ